MYVMDNDGYFLSVLETLMRLMAVLTGLERLTKRSNGASYSLGAGIRFACLSNHYYGGGLLVVNNWSFIVRSE